MQPRSDAVDKEIRETGERERKRERENERKTLLEQLLAARALNQTAINIRGTLGIWFIRERNTFAD